MFAARQIRLVAAVVAVAAVGLGNVSTARADGSYDFGQGYAVLNPDVTCQTRVDAYGNLAKRDVLVNAPTMFSPIPNQRVSYQPVLNRWNGSAWVTAAVYPEVFGSTAGVMPGNYGFNVPLAGASYWKVSIMYRWYWNGVVSRSRHIWAGTHQLFYLRDGYQPLWGNAGAHCLLSVTNAN